MNKFVVRHFKDQALSGLKPIPDPGRGQDSDKTVINPSLKAGVNLDSRLKTAGMTILIKEIFSGENSYTIKLPIL